MMIESIRMLHSIDDCDDFVGEAAPKPFAGHRLEIILGSVSDEDYRKILRLMSDACSSQAPSNPSEERRDTLDPSKVEWVDPPLLSTGSRK